MCLGYVGASPERGPIVIGRNNRAADETHIKLVFVRRPKAVRRGLRDALRTCISHGRRPTWRSLLFGFGPCTVLRRFSSVPPPFPPSRCRPTVALWKRTIEAMKNPHAASAPDTIPSLTRIRAAYAGGADLHRHIYDVSSNINTYTTHLVTGGQ